MSVKRVAKEVKLSKGLVSKYFNILARGGILRKSRGKFVVQDCIGTKATKILLNLNAFDSDFFKRYSFVKGAGLYGSFVKGTNTEDSDIDMWIVTEAAKEEGLAQLTAALKKKFGNVKPLYLTKEKTGLLKSRDNIFYHSLIFGSINVYGEGIEAV